MLESCTKNSPKKAEPNTNEQPNNLPEPIGHYIIYYSPVCCVIAEDHHSPQEYIHYPIGFLMTYIWAFASELLGKTRVFAVISFTKSPIVKITHDRNDSIREAQEAILAHWEIKSGEIIRDAHTDLDRKEQRITQRRRIGSKFCIYDYPNIRHLRICNIERKIDSLCSPDYNSVVSPISISRTPRGREYIIPEPRIHYWSLRLWSGKPNYVVKGYMNFYVHRYTQEACPSASILRAWASFFKIPYVRVHRDTKTSTSLPLRTLLTTMVASTHSGRDQGSHRHHSPYVCMRRKIK